MFSTKTESEIMNQKHLFEEDSVEQMRLKLTLMKGKNASKKSITLAILKMIPFFNKFISAADGVGNVLISLVEIEGHITNATQAAGSAFGIIKLISSAFDFIRVPCIYLGAIIAGQKLPMTLSRNARFLYASVLLGITITAFAFPPSAPIIALVSALFALGYSVITMANLFHKRDLIRDQLKKVENDIEITKTKTLKLIDELEHLERKAKAARYENKVDSQLLDEIKSKRDEIKSQLNSLQELYDQQEYAKQKLEKLGLAHALDKTMGVALACLALIGVVVSLVFPPVGLIILAVTASIGFTYLIGRVTYPLFKYLGEKLVNYFTKKEEPEEIELDDLTHSAKARAKYQADSHTLQQEVERLEKLVAEDPRIEEQHFSRATAQEYRMIPLLFAGKLHTQQQRNDSGDGDDEGEHPSMGG